MARVTRRRLLAVGAALALVALTGVAAPAVPALLGAASVRAL